MSQPRKIVHLPKVRLLNRGATSLVPVIRGSSSLVPVTRGSSSQVPVTRGSTSQVPVIRGSSLVPVTQGSGAQAAVITLQRAVQVPSTRSSTGSIIQLNQVQRSSSSNPGEPVQRLSGIRITNVKSIKPPDPEVLKKQQEDALRVQLQQEIVSRSRTCSTKEYTCSLPVLTGQQYCVRHVLQDPAAPFKSCAHERCMAPVPTNTEGDQPMCFEHARAALLARQRAAAPPPPVATTETMLNMLQHYQRPERSRTISCTSSVSVVSDINEQEPTTPLALDPFKQIDARAINTQHSSSLMECASASDSDGDSVIIGENDVCRGDSGNSDAEEAPAESQPLWRAGVYTAEEAICEAKTTLKALQSAYIGQMGRLKALLGYERRRYFAARRHERDHYCSINAQALSGQSTPKERRQLRKLKAYAGYRRRHLIDAVMHKKLHYKRAKVNEPPNRPLPSQSRCIFSEGGVRCPNGSLPAARHCIKHIIEDANQVLFTTCNDARGLVSCREVIPRLPHHPACVYHTSPPAYTMFTLKKDDSDSETESNCSVDSQLTSATFPDQAMDILDMPI